MTWSVFINILWLKLSLLRLVLVLSRIQDATLVLNESKWTSQTLKHYKADPISLWYYYTSPIKIPFILHHYNTKLFVGYLHQCNISSNWTFMGVTNAQNFSKFYVSMNFSVLQIIRRRSHISLFHIKLWLLLDISPPKLIQVQHKHSDRRY